MARRSDGSQVEMSRAQYFEELMDTAMGVLQTDEFKKLEMSIKQNALRQLGFDANREGDKLDLCFTPFSTMEFYKALDLRVREGDFTISATELGEGFQNALVLSILQAYEQRRKEGAVLLIEEPEMFLHPQMQRSLYKTLREIGEKNQVIYTTHSPHFVAVPDYHEVILVRKGMDGTTVRCSDLPETPKRREKLIKELDPERNEFFFATRLLLVEGDTEKLAFPEYARRLELDLDREGATIVEVGGKRNLPEFAQIALSFGIPTGVVYDEDSSDFSDRDGEQKFNSELDRLEKPNGLVKVWRLSKKYEAFLRKTLGEETYKKLCQKYPEVGKPTRARLIAMEESFPIPELFEEILRWLANKSE